MTPVFANSLKLLEADYAASLKLADYVVRMCATDPATMRLLARELMQRADEAGPENDAFWPAEQDEPTEAEIEANQAHMLGLGDFPSNEALGLEVGCTRRRVWPADEPVPAGLSMQDMCDGIRPDAYVPDSIDTGMRRLPDGSFGRVCDFNDAEEFRVNLTMTPELMKQLDTGPVGYVPVAPHPDDMFIWPCGTTASREDIDRGHYAHKSDDYRRMTPEEEAAQSNEG